MDRVDGEEHVAQRDAHERTSELRRLVRVGVGARVTVEARVGARVRVGVRIGLGPANPNPPLSRRVRLQHVHALA